MFPSRTFPVLVLLILLSAGSHGLMKQSTCDAIKEQLRLIDGSITDAAYTLQSQPFYTHRNTDDRLQLLLDRFDTIHNGNSRYVDKMATFVRGKLNQFGIIPNGLLDDTAKLEKVFRHVEERNTFQRRQLSVLEEMNQNVNTEIDAYKSQLRKLEQRKQELQSQQQEIASSVAIAEKDILKLQAKINDNPLTVQG